VSKENFNRIMAGLDEARRHADGEDVPGMVIHRPDPVSLVAAVKARGWDVSRYPDDPAMWGIWDISGQRATSEAYRCEADAYAEVLGWMVAAELTPFVGTKSVRP